MTEREMAREYLLDQAIAAGKFPVSRKAAYRKMYDQDPVGTQQLIARLGAVKVPATAAEPDAYPQEWIGKPRKGDRPRVSAGEATRSHAHQAAAPAQSTRPAKAPTGDAYPADWLPDVAARKAQGRRSRVTRAED